MALYDLADRKGWSLPQALAIPSWEITEWQGYYEIKDWINQGQGKHHDYRRGLEFAKAVQAIEVERYEKKRGRTLRP